ncbi:MAG: ribosome maturation factor RimP [Eggerthellaceae bacterium]|nr:ribosome maturation factor RimP [Eggerthellaceae bacterium]
MLSAKEQSLLDALEPRATEHGLEIVTIEVTGASRSPVIRVYIDVEGGISFNELTDAQSWMGEMLDEIDPFPGAYVLEVSSPGIDRPLRTLDHFRAHVGEDVRLKMLTSIDGRKSFKGKLASVDGDDIVIETEAGSVTLPHHEISKANVIGKVEF